MQDLFLGLTVMSSLTVGLGLLAWWVTARAPIWLLDVLAATTIGGIVLFIVFLRDNVILAKWLPYSNLVIVGNWLPLFAGVLVGLLCRRIKGRTLARVLWSTLLLTTASSAMFDPFRGQPPSCENKVFEVCRGCLGIGGHQETLRFHPQTSNVTCSPAAACTLLEDYDIHLREGEMARMSLTRRGTTWQGLYRGLMLATEGTDWTVEVFETDYESLIAMPGPKLLFVELVKGTEYDPRYVTEWGWSPGQRHTVVFYHPSRDERVIIGDPAVGVEEWSLEDMRTLWHGRGMRLVPRGRE